MCTSSYSRTFVCFDCRKSYKTKKTFQVEGEGQVGLCPECKKPAHNLGNRVTIPRRTNDSGWKRLEILYFDAGRKFLGCCGHGGGYKVTTVGEAKAEAKRVELREQIMTGRFVGDGWKIFNDPIHRKNWQSV